MLRQRGLLLLRLLDWRGPRRGVGDLDIRRRDRDRDVSKAENLGWERHIDWLAHEQAVDIVQDGGDDLHRDLQIRGARVCGWSRLLSRRGCGSDLPGWPTKDCRGYGLRTCRDGSRLLQGRTGRDL